MNPNTLYKMKKTVNVNIASQAFTLDDDAYAALKDYLDDISSRLEVPDRAEVLEDVEGRVADIFRENLTMQGQVVSAVLVRKAMAIIGRADCFGERAAGTPPPYPQAQRPEQPRRLRLYRSRHDRVIGGVCAGLADYFDLDPTLVRIATVVLAFATASLAFWGYLICWIVIPKEPFDGTGERNYR